MIGHNPIYLPHWHKYDYTQNPDDKKWNGVRDDTHYLGEVE